MNVELLNQIMQVCVVPLLGILTKFLVDFLTSKKEEAKANTDSVTAKKYLDMITDTVTRCVIATNQTYVNSLKAEGLFDADAQKEAFQKTMDSVLAILSEDAKNYIQETTSDLNKYLTELIEAEVNVRR